MVRVRLAADMPAAERPKIEVLDTRGPAFHAQVAALTRRKGAAFTVCDVPVGVRAH